MSKFMRTLLAVLGIGALMLTLVVYKPASTSAANLTGGNYTYVINGEEETFAFDPVVRQTGTLLPIEVFQRFGITVEDSQTKTITLSKDTASAKVTLGSTSFDLNGQAKSLSTAALRLNGRVFLPSDLLKEFGVDFAQDGTYVVLRSFSDKMLVPKTLSDADWASARSGLSFTGTIKTDTGSYVGGEFTLLNETIVNATNLNLTYGNRARLEGLLQTNTLVLVNLTNLSSKSGGMLTTGAYLVDDQRNEYDVQSVLDIGWGLLTNKLAPGAQRYGVLVYPKLMGRPNNLVLYYDNNGASLGVFVNVNK